MTMKSFYSASITFSSCRTQSSINLSTSRMNLWPHWAWTSYKTCTFLTQIIWCSGSKSWLKWTFSSLWVEYSHVWLWLIKYISHTGNNSLKSLSGTLKPARGCIKMKWTGRRPGLKESKNNWIKLRPYPGTTIPSKTPSGINLCHLFYQENWQIWNI